MTEQPFAIVPRRTRSSEGGSRRELLVMLIGICRNLERMQATEGTREACRQVSGRLQRWLDGRTGKKAAARRR